MTTVHPRRRRLAAATLAAAAILTATSTTAQEPSLRGRQRSTPQALVLETTVAPIADEDIAEPCKYELTILASSRTVKGVLVVFERSLGTLQYYRDPDVRAFARKHDFALLFPFHCRSKSDSTGDMNVDPKRGLGRALLTALEQLAERSHHAELSTAKLILLGFSGTGSLVARMVDYAPDRVLASVPTHPGHFDPVGMDTINLSPGAAAVPQLILVGSADAVSGTQRPYEYFRRHFEKGAPWTFVVQNAVPHCCIMNAKQLVLDWLDDVVIRKRTRAVGRYAFMMTVPTDATGCPGQSAPVRTSLCLGPKDDWGGQNWSVASVTIQKRERSPQGMFPAGWLPSERFAEQWRSFVSMRAHPVTMPP